ncbi:hypothetical protein LAZ67_2001936 [Cordylochernes scorpioides]|uniref:Transposase n=1 Tax=Cordylochernes scorpioides TaxID=51811 RepID=A0ABY6K1N0_9ARAC|nr:hypothetical protein LAZ67_2001936 [Cordylochernes scorpioides]
MWDSKNWFLHHDHAWSHIAKSVLNFLDKIGAPIFSQPFYSPNLAPNNFFLFPKIKMVPSYILGKWGRYCWNFLSSMAFYADDQSNELARKLPEGH